MSEPSKSLYAGKSLLRILASYFFLFLMGDLLVSIFFDLLFSIITLPYREMYVTCRMLGSLALTVLLFWLYTTRRLHTSMGEFGITWKISLWALPISLLLPGILVVTYLAIGETTVQVPPFWEGFWLILGSVAISLKSGITEEMLFRGFLMKLVEKKWGKALAIFAPSFLFGLVHLTSMTTFSLESVLLLLVSGTLVGVMFSLVAYKDGSIANSALVHGLWNFFIITGIFRFVTQPEPGSAIFTVTIPGDSLLLSGGEFGVEASLVAILAYALVCGFVVLTSKKKITETGAGNHPPRNPVKEKEN